MQHNQEFRVNVVKLCHWRYNINLLTLSSWKIVFDFLKLELSSQSYTDIYPIDMDWANEKNKIFIILAGLQEMYFKLQQPS